MKEDKRKWYKKKRFIIPIISFVVLIVIIIILGIIGIIGLSQIPEEEWDKIIEESLDAPLDYPEPENEQQAEFIGLLETIESIEEPALIAIDDYYGALGTDQIYQVANAAKDASEAAWREFSNLAIHAETFDKEIRELIEKMIHEDFAMIYKSYMIAFEKEMNYIDSMEQIDSDEREREFDNAFNYQKDAVDKVIAIEKKLGLAE